MTSCKMKKEAGMNEMIVKTTSLILPQAVATKLDLPDDLVGYFSLFLIREGADGGLTCKSQQQQCKKSEEFQEFSLQIFSLLMEVFSIIHYCIIY